MIFQWFPMSQSQSHPMTVPIIPMDWASGEMPGCGALAIRRARGSHAASAFGPEADAFGTAFLASKESHIWIRIHKISHNDTNTKNISQRFLDNPWYKNIHNISHVFEIIENFNQGKKIEKAWAREWSTPESSASWPVELHIEHCAREVSFHRESMGKSPPSNDKDDKVV